MNNISVFIITKNEAENLPQCLAGVQNLADEVIVVDSFSTDDTVKIAHAYGAKVYQRELVSFTTQKQYALDQCTNKWALNLDADEIVTEPLKAEILEVIKKDDIALYLIPNNNVFLGRRMRHSGLGRQYKERLVQRQKAHYIGGLVHEVITADGPSARLKNNYLHTPYRDIAHYFTKFNNYTSLGALTMYQAGKKFSVYNLLRQPVDFIKIYIFKLAFLDGIQGFLWSLFSSFYPTVKYAKLWNLYQTQGKKGGK